MKRTRKSISYKINMWVYRLTFQDMKKAIKIVLSYLFEIIIALLGFVIIFIFPAIFH